MQILKKSIEINENYAARIARVDAIHAIPDAHSIVKAVLGTDTVVVSADTKVGDIVVFFPVGCCITEQYLMAHNLYDKSSAHKNANYEEYTKLVAEYNELANQAPKSEATIQRIAQLDQQMKRMVGFFSHRGNVRCLKLRGEMSMGYVAPVATLEAVWPGLKHLIWTKHLNETFDMIGDDRVCWKYIPVTRTRNEAAQQEVTYKMPWYKRSLRKLKKFNRLIPGFFKPHYDTAMLERNAHFIDPDMEITETVKVHGCVERNTIVNTQEYGDLTIGEIVDKKLECKIKAYDTDIQQVVYVPIADYYLLKNDGVWYDIELENGTTITITGNNPVWIPELQCYRRVDELDGTEHLLVD